MRIGSLERRDLICREFINGFKSYEASALPWPELKAGDAARLRTIPFWSKLIRTELVAAERARRIAEDESDDAMREALGLLAYEKTRTARLIESMMQRYGIKTQRLAPERRHLSEWGFILSGTAETYDSIFAFGLFRLTVASRLLPPPLLAIFEQVISEESRHVLFFHNWAILRTRYTAFPNQPLVICRRSAALAMRTLQTFGTAVRIAIHRQPPAVLDNFAAWALAQLGPEVSHRGLIEIGLKEFAARMEDFDPRLRRPYFAPRLLRLASHLLKRSPEPRKSEPPVITEPAPADMTTEPAVEPRDQRPADDRTADQRYAHNQYSGFPNAAPNRRRSGWVSMPHRRSRMPVR